MKNSAGFTLVELIVTIVLVGILVGTAVPTFNRMVNETQSQTNISNMVIIKNVLMHYYYTISNHQSRKKSDELDGVAMEAHFKVTSYKLQAASYKLQATSCKLHDEER